MSSLLVQADGLTAMKDPAEANYKVWMLETAETTSGRIGEIEERGFTSQ